MCIENINTMKNNYTAMEPKYLDVNKKIGHNIVDLVQASGDGKVYVDDVLIAVWEAIVGIDVKSLTPEQWRKKHILSMRSVLTNKALLNRYKNYKREALQEVLRKEQLVKYEDEGDLKRAFLSDIKLINDIDEYGMVVLNEKQFTNYLSLQRSEWQYGLLSIGEEKNAHRAPKKKIILTSFSLTKNIEDAITPFIEIYCNDWEYDVEQEHYKWDAIKSFAKTFDIEAENLASNLKESMSPTFNLLAGPYYYPLSMLRQMALYSPEDVRNMIFELYDENVSLSNRCTKFLQDFESLLEENRKVGNFKDNDRSMQSVRAISVYLSLKYPNIHYLYKQSMYSDFKSITGADLPSLSQFESVLVGYEIVCEEIRKILLKNERLIALHDKSYPEDTSDYHLLTQDFLYYCAYHYQVRKDE